MQRSRQAAQKFLIWKRSKSIFAERLKKICRDGRSKKVNTTIWWRVRLRVKKKREREKLKNSKIFKTTRWTVISTRLDNCRGTLKIRIRWLMTWKLSTRLWPTNFKKCSLREQLRRTSTSRFLGGFLIRSRQRTSLTFSSRIKFSNIAPDIYRYSSFFMLIYI